MLRKSITFNDLDGRPVTEDFYFNFTKAELAEMKLSYEDGLEKYLEEIGKKKNQSEVIPAFKRILGKTVGRRHEDGRQFIKSQEITDYFMQTEAYSELFMELLSNPGQMAVFIEGCMPADLVAEAKKQGVFAQLTGVTVVEDVPKDVITVNLDQSAIDASLQKHEQDYLTEQEAKGHPVVENVIVDETSAGLTATGTVIKKITDYTEGELGTMPIGQFLKLLGEEKGNVPKHVLVVAMRRANEQ